MNNLISLLLEMVGVFNIFLACRLSSFWTSNNYCYTCNLIFILGSGKFRFPFPVINHLHFLFTFCFLYFFFVVESLS